MLLHHWARRVWYRRRVNGAAMLSFMDEQLPSAGTDYREIEWLAVDLETTDLDPRNGEIVSIGWVPIHNGMVEMEGAGEMLVRPSMGVGQSAVFHQLHDTEVAGGYELEEALCRFLEIAKGRVMICHNAVLDVGFLNKAARKCFNVPLILPVVDTLQLEKKRLEERSQSPHQDALRLHACRERYNLPDYPAHRAVTDALACAELFLAWAAHRNGTRSVPLKECLRGGQ